MLLAGLGLDADVVRRVNAQRAAGRRASQQLYVRAGIRQFFVSASRGPALQLERPGADPVPLALALVCNTSPWTYLGPRAVDPCPQASFDTGLDVFGLRRLSTVSTLRHLAQILRPHPRPRGRHLVPLHDLPELVLTAQRPLPFQLDGEDLGERTRVELRSVPEALQVVV